MEGIRVEFTPPGYKNHTILAIANIKNSKYQTNAARSAIELDANSEILADIYDIYCRYIQKQMDNLEKLEYSKSWAMSEGRYLMRPLIVDNYSNSHAKPMDEDVLTYRLAKIKCIALENEGKRNIVSAEHIYNIPEINIFESKMTQAAEFLLREIKSEATLNDLIGVVCSKDNFLNNASNVICNYDTYNMLHQYAISNKEVSSIVVSYAQRRIKLTYSVIDGRWMSFNLSDRDIGRTLFIPKGDFDIEGLKDEVGVKTFGTIFIKSGTSLYNYIIKMIDCFMSDNAKENRILLEIFLSNIFDSRILEEVYTQDILKGNAVRQYVDKSNRYFGVSDEMIEKMWSKINIEEFYKNILTQNYTLYSIDNWSRKGDLVI